MNKHVIIVIATFNHLVSFTAHGENVEQEFIREVFWRNRSAKESVPTYQSEQYRRLKNRFKQNENVVRAKRWIIPIEPLATKLITDAAGESGLAGVFISDAKTNPNLLGNPYFKIKNRKLFSWHSAPGEGEVSIEPDPAGIFTDEGVLISVEAGATLQLIQSVKMERGTFEMSCVWAGTANAHLSVNVNPHRGVSSYQLSENNTQSFSRRHKWRSSAADLISTKPGNWDFSITIKGGLNPGKVQIAYASLEMLIP